MSAMRFHTKQKGDLPQYSFTLGKPETLDTELNSVACYRLGVILYPDINNGKEVTK